MAKTMLDIARTAFQNSGLLPLYPNQCPGDIPDECYDARRALKAIPADVVDEIARLKATIEPVRSWYDGDGELTDVAEMLTSAIADLQEDRAAVLKLTTRVAELEKLREEDFDMRMRLG